VTASDAGTVGIWDTSTGYGFHPLQVYLDETREALGGLLRPGNAGSNTADDHEAVLDLALAQIPAQYIEGLEILVRADSAGATHGLVDYCREGNLRFSVGYELTESVRCAILEIPEDAWVPALDQDGCARENGEVAEITDQVDLSGWPERSRLIVRRERPHPGAQLSFTDHDGYRFQAILTDQEIAVLECRHRQHAHVEDRIRDDKDTGLAKFPFKEFALNEVWLEIVMLAHDLIVWTQALVLVGELANAEPKRLRYRLLHVAGRLAFSARRAKLHLQDTWPWPPNSSPRFTNSTRWRLRAADNRRQRPPPPPADRSATRP
jgi:Transposase DDE domain group 1